MASRISVVVPALNEEACVTEAIRSALDGGPDVDVMMVDGGSRDRTRAMAEAAGATVIACGPGRGVQLDRGARETGGDWLVFLHADTRLERGWAAALRGLPDDVVGGAFRFAVDSPRRRYRCLEAGVAVRCRLFRLAFGDQGIFVRRPTYFALGGFRPIPLMEDVAFMKDLAGAGRVAFPTVRAFTSARRWERLGLVGTTLRNWWLLGLFAAGLPPKRLAKMYYAQPG